VSPCRIHWSSESKSRITLAVRQRIPRPGGHVWWDIPSDGFTAFHDLDFGPIFPLAVSIALHVSLGIPANVVTWYKEDPSLVYTWQVFQERWYTNLCHSASYNLSLSDMELIKHISHILDGGIFGSEGRFCLTGFITEVSMWWGRTKIPPSPLVRPIDFGKTS
jgi:hypothetical protein